MRTGVVHELAQLVKEYVRTFVRRRLHSAQAMEARLALLSSLGAGSVGVAPPGVILGAIGRKGLELPCWAMMKNGGRRGKGSLQFARNVIDQGYSGDSSSSRCALV